MSQISESMHAKISVKGVDISIFNRITLEKVLIEDQKKDTLFYVGSVDLKIDSLKLLRRKVHFGDIQFNDPYLRVQKDAKGFNYDFMISKDTTRGDTLRPWYASFKNFFLRNGRVSYSDQTVKDTLGYGINVNDIQLSKLNIAVVNVHYTDTATTFLLDNASVREKSGFSIGDLRFSGKISKRGLELSKITVVADHSHINAKHIRISTNQYYGRDSLFSAKSLTLSDKYIIDSDFNESMISLTDVAYVVPELWGMNEPILFSGGVKGTLSNLKFKNINFKIGRETQVNADLEMQGLPEWKNTFIYFKLYDNVINFNDLAAIRLPEKAKNQFPSIPKSLRDNPRITYQGNFTGFPEDFVAYGTLGGMLGKLSSDIAIKPQKNGEINIKGKISTKSFEIGKLIDYQPLGAVSMEIEVNGSSSGRNKINALIHGNIDSLYFNNYRIDSIYIDGKAKDRSFEGDLKVQDDNLRMVFAGKADFESAIPEFRFSSTLSKANLSVLGLEPQSAKASLAFRMNANFTGSHIDDVNGELTVDNFNYTHNDQSLIIKQLIAKTTNTDLRNTITLRSDIVDADISGKYKFGELDLTFRDYLKHFLPSAKLPFSDRESTGKNAFDFNINLKKAEELGQFMANGLKVQSPIRLTGNIDSDRHLLNLDASVSKAIYNSTQVQNLTINSRNIKNNWLFRIGAEEALFGGSLRAENFSINNSLAHDSLTTAITWNNASTPTNSGKIDLLGVFHKTRDGRNYSDFYLSKSNIWLADSLWQIEKSALHIDSTSIAINNFNIHHNQEHFRIDGKVADNSRDKINIDFSKVNLGILNQLLGEDIGIKGELNGNAQVGDPYNSLMLKSDLKISNFNYLEKDFGDIVMENNWDQEKQQLNTSLQLVNQGKAGFDLHGFYRPSSDSLAYHTAFNDYPLETLLPILNSFANSVEGIGNGKVDITGYLSNPKFRGKVAVSKARIGIDYTKVLYSLEDTVRFQGDSIVFKNIEVRDQDNKKARFNGVITHNLFSHMTYDMGATTDDILVLNTNASDNNLFYGVAHAAGSIRISGKIASVRLDMSLTSKQGTQINVPLENPESVSTYNFVRFVNPDTIYQNKVKVPELTTESGDLEVNLDVHATPDAKIQLLFNSTVGDAINGYGNGDLRFIYDKEGNFYIYGDYKIDKGDYIFTIQNVLVRKFKINQGGLISWNGDPYGAVVDLDATYTLKAPINYLLLNYMQQDNSRRIPVECQINLSRKLLNPTVKMDIKFPTADERTRDELQQFISNQDDINRQMVSLLVMGQFFTPEYLKGRQDFQTTAGSVVGTTTSDILSNQLSNWLSQISSDFDIGFNYRPGDQVNANQMEVALSTQILNDRVTINGNIGSNSNLQSSTTNPVVGEVEVFVKLTPNGKLQLKAYNRANDDLIYDTSLYKQGIGLSFREEFDNLGDLFNYYKKKKLRNRYSIKNDTIKRVTN